MLPGRSLKYPVSTGQIPHNPTVFSVVFYMCNRSLRVDRPANVSRFLRSVDYYQRLWIYESIQSYLMQE